MIREYIIKFSDENIIIDRPQELVRCKDCRYGCQLSADYISCEISEENESGCHISHKPDWFCADGKRKNESVRGERSKIVGEVCDKGILWTNIKTKEQTLENYD